MPTDRGSIVCVCDGYFGLVANSGMAELGPTCIRHQSFAGENMGCLVGTDSSWSLSEYNCHGT